MIPTTKTIKLPGVICSTPLIAFLVGHLPSIFSPVNLHNLSIKILTTCPLLILNLDKYFLFIHPTQ